MIKKPELDPFGRPIESYSPDVMTPEEAKTRMAEVAREEERSFEDAAKELQESREAQADEVGSIDDLDDLDDILGGEK